MLGHDQIYPRVNNPIDYETLVRDKDVILFFFYLNRYKLGIKCNFFIKRYLFKVISILTGDNF